MRKKQNEDRLAHWQERFAAYSGVWQDEVGKMDEREDIYLGKRGLRELVPGDATRETRHLRRLAGELIESEVDATVPMPRVTAYETRDENLATMIEDMLRNRLDKWPSEVLNDQLERTVPIQGGAFTVLEWDNTRRDHTHVGESVVSFLHPKQFLPQPGITSRIEDMDAFGLKLPKTKSWVRRVFGVDVSEAREEDPELRGDGDPSDELVTLNVAYYRTEKGIGKFSWVGDTVLEDLEDYQARRLPRCVKCGRPKNTVGVTPLGAPTLDGTPPETDGAEPEGDRCIYCGSSKWEDADAEYMEVWDEVRVGDKVIPGASWQEDEDGVEYVPTRIPYYKPDVYPVFLHRNVSVWGQLLGSSDIDCIADQQNTYNRVSQKIVDSLLTAGSYISLPVDPAIKLGTGEAKEIRLKNPADKACIDVYDLKCDISQPLGYLSYVYEEARQTIGITDSYLGRQDTTATSGKAKAFSAQQAAGRLQSKRVMKRAAWAELFEAVFKFELAYADEPRPVSGHDKNGNNRDEEWNKWLFLEQDEAGEWYWNDRFLFSCDADAPLAANREARWAELRSMFNEGGFGNPTDMGTQILYWQMMEEQHYPGASQVKKRLVEAQREAAMKQAALANAQAEAARAGEEAVARFRSAGEGGATYDL